MESYDKPRQHIKKAETSLCQQSSIESKLWFFQYEKTIVMYGYVWIAIVMYGCESWTIKKAECWRIDAFKLWLWRRLLRAPWTARRSNQSTLKEISTEYSFEGLMLKLKLQYFGHLMRRTDSLEKTLMLGNIEGKRRRGWQRMRWFVGTSNLIYMSLRKLWGLLMDREAWHAAVHGDFSVRHDWVSEMTELN